MTTISKKDFIEVVRLTPLVSIDLIVRNARGQVLLGWRKNQPAKDTWFVPGGRIRKEDEGIPSAFKRVSRKELKVELDIQDAEFLGVYEHRYDTNVAEKPGFGTYYIVLAYQADLDVDLDSLPKDQHSNYQWFYVDDLRNCSNVHQNVKNYFAASS